MLEDYCPFFGGKIRKYAGSLDTLLVIWSTPRRDFIIFGKTSILSHSISVAPSTSSSPPSPDSSRTPSPRTLPASELFSSTSGIIIDPLYSREKRIILGHKAIIDKERQVFKYELKRTTPTIYDLKDGAIEYLVVDVARDDACGFHALGIFGKRSEARNQGCDLMLHRLKHELSQREKPATFALLRVAQSHDRVRFPRQTGEKDFNYCKRFIDQKIRDPRYWLSFDEICILALALGINYEQIIDIRGILQRRTGIAITADVDTYYVYYNGHNHNHYQILIPTTTDGVLLKDSSDRIIPRETVIEEVRAYLRKMHDHVQRKLQEVVLIGVTEASTDSEDDVASLPAAA